MGNARELGGLTFNSQKTSITAPNVTATTLFALPNVQFATYLVTAGIISGDVANYQAVALVCTQGTSAKITPLVSGDLLTLGISGLNVRVTQSSGLIQDVEGFLTRLNAG
jgi:hypothetical protein